MLFKDNFSKQSDLYLRYRPHYPDELYQYLASLTTGKKLAWDCGTGNGQAAIGIANYYETVVATDPSEQQITNAIPYENVSYSVSKAEQSPLAENSVDLITVANALHWFEFDKFYTEVNRVLKPGGVLAAWAYGNPSHSDRVDKVITYFHDVVLGDYWLNENRLVEKKYSTVPFPFSELVTPDFKIKRELSRNDLVGLFHTWSAVQRYKDRNGKDPVALIEKDLDTAWDGGPLPKLFTWELVLKAGRKPLA
jgi:SAM-dependent methyltransferase